MLTYEQALEFALSFPDMERFAAGPEARVMSLDCMRSLLSRLGHPQNGRVTVHVTGSKGKGSTAHFIASVLGASGLRTALYTSPHLHCYRERIAIGGRPVAPAVFAAGVEAITSAVRAEHDGPLGPVSTFGVMTSLFFHAARASGADCQVVEVGLGGTFDGTNVFAAKEVAVFTPISLEHTKILGATPAEIARNKAGIITPGCTVVLARQNDPGVKAVIAERCRAAGADLVCVDECYAATEVKLADGRQSFVLTGPGGPRRLEIAMLGAHQLDNAAAAAAAIDALAMRGLAVSEHDLRAGLAGVMVPGRLEVLSGAPLVVADGAHNGESMQALCRAIRESFSYRRCIAVLGVHQDKDLPAMLAALKPLADRLVCTRSRSARAASPEAILALAGALGHHGYLSGSVAEALELATALARPGDLICVTGSLSVAAEAREAFGASGASDLQEQRPVAASVQEGCHQIW
ncbi:MAG TPA: cyanophycin synthetase [Candidatus Obscuribacterales bacterium]